jgi:LysM repeat protein
VKKTYLLVSLALVSLACGLSAKSLPTSTSQPPTPLVITVVVVATQEPPTAEPLPTEEPTQTPAPATPTPPATATLPPTDTPLPSETPTISGPITYILQEGDTLFGVAQRFNVDLAVLLAVNPGIDPNAINVGDQIIIPVPDMGVVIPTPESPGWRGPVGFVADPHDGIGLNFINLDGRLITELITPGFPEYDSQRAHIAGSWTGDLSSVPVVYFSAEGPSAGGGTEWLRIVAGSADPVWISVSQFFAMAGASGQPVLAYSTLDFEESQPRSRLYAGSLQTLPGASPLFNIADPDGYMVRPLAVDAEEGSLKGIWYTMAAWGIGGDIVFEPRKGMKYLDMTNGMLNEILNRDMAAWDVSPDRTWVAYSRISGPVSVLNQLTGEEFSYPLLPDSNRGAGNACISPDGLYVAWMEGSGWTMAENPDFHATIRIATTAGVHLTDIPQTAFDNVASSEKISWIQPVGWLDGRTLIVQARFQEWSSAALLRVNFDGSNPLYLATGTFVAFLYP